MSEIKKILDRKKVKKTQFYRSLIKPPFVYGTFKMYYYGWRRPSIENAKYLQKAFNDVLGEKVDIEKLLPTKKTQLDKILVGT